MLAAAFLVEEGKLVVVYAACGVFFTLLSDDLSGLSSRPWPQKSHELDPQWNSDVCADAVCCLTLAILGLLPWVLYSSLDQ